MPGSLAPVRHYQLYRDAIHPGELDPGLAQIQTHDPTARIVWHGFPSELPSNYDRLQKLAANHGMQSGGAFGLDSNSTPASVKGDAMGDVASRVTCTVMLADGESHFDQGGSDKAEMQTIGQHARAKAPNALIIAQPWPEPLVHSGFPYEEENDFVDANAPQYYFNDWIKPLGKERVARLTPIFDRHWAVLNGQIPTNQLNGDAEKRNAGRLASRLRPMLWTIQADGWDDIVWDLITVLLAHPGVIIWCDNGLPRSRSWWVALQAIAELAKRGFTGPRAVWDFQTANPALGTPDGDAGPKTLALLGITWAQPGA